MNQVIKFPDMRPPANRGEAVARLPTPSQYRQAVPIFTSGDAEIANRVRRKRLLLWFGVAVALHAALLLALWLTPPLRIKWTPSPDAWVQVTSLPKGDPAALPKSSAAGGSGLAATSATAQPGKRDKSATPPSSN